MSLSDRSINRAACETWKGLVDLKNDHADAFEASRVVIGSGIQVASMEEATLEHAQGGGSSARRSRSVPMISGSVAAGVADCQADTYQEQWLCE